MLPLAIDSALVQFRRLIDSRIDEQISKVLASE
jgi:hypothetical protein